MKLQRSTGGRAFVVYIGEKVENRDDGDGDGDVTDCLPFGGKRFDCDSLRHTRLREKEKNVIQLAPSVYVHLKNHHFLQVRATCSKGVSFLPSARQCQILDSLKAGHPIAFHFSSIRIGGRVRVTRDTSGVGVVCSLLSSEGLEPFRFRLLGIIIHGKLDSWSRT